MEVQMKRIAIFATLFLPLATQAVDLTLELRGKDISGQTINVDVFNSADGFLTERARVRALNAKAIGDSPAVVVANLPAGKYAVVAYVDRNLNGKIDKNFFGKPTEAYGFSNNARAMFGPPDFAQAAFELGQSPATQSINLQ